jgi:hypothetical protein
MLCFIAAHHSHIGIIHTIMSTLTTNTQANMANVSTLSHGVLICYKVPTLEDANGCAHWHFCITMVLKESDLMGVTDGTLCKLDLTGDPTRHTDWMLKDCQACIQITTIL